MMILSDYFETPTGKGFIRDMIRMGEDERDKIKIQNKCLRSCSKCIGETHTYMPDEQRMKKLISDAYIAEYHNNLYDAVKVTNLMQNIYHHHNTIGLKGFTGCPYAEVYITRIHPDGRKERIKV